MQREREQLLKVRSDASAGLLTATPTCAGVSSSARPGAGEGGGALAAGGSILAGSSEHPERARQVEQRRLEQQRWILHSLEEAVAAPQGSVSALVLGAMSNA